MTNRDVRGRDNLRRLAKHGKSPREQAQDRIVEHLNEHRVTTWTAPFGVVPGLHDLPSGGKVRTILFGIARTLDATVTIWSPTRIVIEGQGAFADLVDGTYESVDEVIECLVSAEERLAQLTASSQDATI